MTSNLEWPTSRPDTPVTYSVLVDMPMDIIYNEKTIYNCERDKYLELLVNHKTMIGVQSAAVGRSNECTEMLLQAKLESSTTDQSTLPTQASEETCTTTREDTEDYWSRDRWTDEEEEEEEINMDFTDTEERDLWPLYTQSIPKIPV
jgi:hypothetical protein